MPLYRSSGGATWRSLHRWKHVRDLLRELIARDIKLRYRGSLLGIAWTLLNPLAELLVLLFVFRPPVQVVPSSTGGAGVLSIATSSTSS